MSTIKKSIIIFNFLFSYILCVGEAGAVFLLINPGSSAAGVGEAQTGKADDAYASYYNPAGLAFLEKPEIALQHVNWLPNLAADIYYEFITYATPIKGIGTFGGHIIYLNLGEQTATDEIGNELGQFKSYMMALNASFGMKVKEHSAVGFNFKVFHQKLAESYYSDIAGTGVGSEVGDPFSTDFAFDIGYLTKFGKEKQHSFGFAIQNIGPEIDFVDAEQADPAPTNMRIGFYTRLYKDDQNSIHLLFDASKLLVASYPEMDWNGNGRIDAGTEEESHTDKWTKALYTAWLDDWHYGGDLNLCEGNCLQELYAEQIAYDNNELDDIIGGYEPRSFIWEANIDSDGNTGTIVRDIYVPNYSNFCVEDIANCYAKNDEDEWVMIDESNYDDYTPLWIDLPHDQLGDDDEQWYDEENPDFWDEEFVYCSQDDVNAGIDGCAYPHPVTGELPEPGALMILEAQFHDTYEIFYTTYSIWNDNGDAVDMPIETESDCENISGSTWDVGNCFVIFPIETEMDCGLAGTYIPGTNWHDGFCYTGRSTCSDIEGDYSCYLDLSYNQEYSFKDDQYGVFNPFGNKEKGTGEDRKFSDEFKEMIYNFGFEWWYTDNFAMRLGYIYDEEGDIKNPTFGAGVHFDRYGFDFGYTAGDKGHPRANTMFFSLSLGI